MSATARRTEIAVMKIYSVSTLTAALVLLAPAAALADNNLGAIVQDGDTNKAAIVQTGDGNVAGDDDTDIVQHGFDNFLTLTQSGDDNTIGSVGGGLSQQSPERSGDLKESNSADITQSSNGNWVGEVTQTNKGAHGSTGNTLTVVQDRDGFDVIGGIAQTTGDGAAANLASIRQSGAHNWLDRLEQTSTSDGSKNQVIVTINGNYNGIDQVGQAGPGALLDLAGAVGAVSARISQSGNDVGGSGNVVNLALDGDNNQYGFEQRGIDNSVGITISGLGNAFGVFQSGQHNNVTANGMTAAGNDFGARQTGEGHVATAILGKNSTGNEIGIGQDGDNHDAELTITGNTGIFGVSQTGRGQTATFAITGDDDVVLGIQAAEAGAALTASVGNTMTVSIIGDRNNARGSGFSGVALAAAQGAPGIPPRLAPDASLMLSPGTGADRLVPGVLVQVGEGNGMDIRIGTTAAASGNLFAALQHGNRSQLTAVVNGTANQFVVLQMGNNDETGISQDGDHNLIAVSQ
jgi:hypothetical protein